SLPAELATTEIYPLSLHDALPIFVAHAPHRVLPRGPHRLEHVAQVLEAPAERQLPGDALGLGRRWRVGHGGGRPQQADAPRGPRSEEHTSELQSRGHLVCRLLLEK